MSWPWLRTAQATRVLDKLVELDTSMAMDADLERIRKQHAQDEQVARYLRSAWQAEAVRREPVRGR